VYLLSSLSVVIAIRTGAKAILVGGIFVPPIVGCLAYAYSVWVRNDYELIVWPPKDESESPNEIKAPSDLEVAFDMIEELFGDGKMPETDDVGVETGETRTMKGFALPPLEVTGPKIDKPIKVNITQDFFLCVFDKSTTLFLRCLPCH